MNIHEDLLREDVTAPAKGVLFGNGFRLSKPTERDTQFTSKCISASASSGTALITTSDLFAVAHYLSGRQDETYAKICREALLNGKGLTVFPAAPANDDVSNGDLKEGS